MDGNESLEALRAENQRLHEELNVPYYYMEWRQALANLR